MVRKLKNLQERNGRNAARLVIPLRLRPYMNGKCELRKALGGDYRSASRSLPSAVAELQHMLALGERRAASHEGRVAEPGRYPLTHDQIAWRSYHARLTQDEAARNQNPHYATVGIDDGYVAQIRSGIAGTLSDPELNELFGHRIAKFAFDGNTTAEIGSPDWRGLARALCISELEALQRVSERDDGNYSGKITAPMLINLEPPADDLSPVSINSLFDAYVASRQLIGSQKDSGRRQRPVIKALIKFLHHQDARRITRKEIIEWRDDLLKTLAPKTVSDIYLSAVRTMFQWAVDNEKLPSNPAETVRQPKAKHVVKREHGYTDAEALILLRFCNFYRPQKTAGGKVRELPSTTAAKRWVSLVCAFTGSRISEVVQLRKMDISKVGDIYVMRITPEAGSVKNGEYRDVPLHDQIIDRGFIEFVDGSSDGHLFNRSESTDPAAKLRSARRVGGQIADWLGDNKLVPEGIWPNHGFRHRFKTVGREVGVADRVLDAICGHEATTVGDDYGDVSILAMHRVL